MPLTQKDLSEIRQVVKEEVEERAKNLPTRDEFFSTMDEVMGELKAIRGESMILLGRTSEHEDRISALEEIHHKASIVSYFYPISC